MPFKFQNSTPLTIRVSICPNVRHRDRSAVVVVFSESPISGPVLKTQQLAAGQTWTLPDYDYGRPIKLVDKLSLKKSLQRRGQAVLFHLLGLMN